MSQTTTEPSLLPMYYFDNKAWDEWQPQIREYTVIAALSCALYGMGRYAQRNVGSDLTKMYNLHRDICFTLQCLCMFPSPVRLRDFTLL